MRTWKRNSLADVKVREDGGGGGAPGAGTPLQPKENTVVKQVVPLQAMKAAGHQICTVPPMEGTAGGHALKKAEAHGELIQKLCPGKGLWPMEGTRSCLKTLSVERTYNGVVLQELQPTGRVHTGEVCGGLSPMVETPSWSSGRM